MKIINEMEKKELKSSFVLNTTALALIMFILFSRIQSIKWQRLKNTSQ